MGKCYLRWARGVVNCETLATFAGLGSARVHACWRARLALANFFKFLDKLFDRSQRKHRFGAPPKPAREPRALPQTSDNTPKIDKSA
jgi:hypothetical protein